MGAIEGFLKTIGLFGDLNEAEIALLSALTRFADYGSGASIIREGEQSDDFFVVHTGSVKVSRGNGQGGEILLTTLKAGEYFGEAALFHDVPRSANVVAAEKVRVLTISRESFEGFLKANPMAANRVLHAMLKAVFERLSKTSAELAAVDRMLI